MRTYVLCVLYTKTLPRMNDLSLHADARTVSVCSAYYIVEKFSKDTSYNSRTKDGAIIHTA